MAALSDLKTLLETAAADITNTIDKTECLVLIGEWYALRTALAALQSGSVTSYSINNRTVTRRDLPGMEAAERRMYQRIQEFLYLRGCGLVDCRVDTLP